MRLLESKCFPTGAIIKEIAPVESARMVMGGTLVNAEGFDLFVEGVENLEFGVQKVIGDVNFVVVRVDQASLGRAEVR